MFIGRLTKRKLKILRGDNSSEFVSKEFKKFLKFHGIQYQKSTPYSPQQNGVAKLMDKTIVEAIRSMLQHTSLSPKFWAKAVNTNSTSKLGVFTKL